jgi:hypothetical protein
MEQQTIAQQAIELLSQDGGFSLSITGNTPHDGAMVSIYPQYERQLATVSESDIAQYLFDHLDVLSLPGHYLGAWIDSGTVYLDVSINAPLDKALDLARRYSQLAVFDLATFESVYVQ